jgi:hypothetical protein
MSAQPLLKLVGMLCAVKKLFELSEYNLRFATAPIY